MAFFHPEKPLTHRQVTVRWVIAGVLLLATLSLATWSAVYCAREQYGYVAGYSFAGVLYMSALILCVGLLGLPYWRLRSTGAALIVCGFALYGGFVGEIEVLKKFDKVAWMHEPPLVHFGPELQASVVIFYKPGTTSDQINAFIANVLDAPKQPDREGQDLPGFVTSYLAVSDKSREYNGSALQFSSNETTAEVERYITAIESDPIVFRVLRNVAPEDVVLPALTHHRPVVHRPSTSQK